MDSTLLKGLTVLEAVAASTEAVGVTVLARRLDLPKSNVHRTLQTLQSAGYVVARPGGTYECTLKLFEMGSALADRIDVRTAARTAMESLAEATRETVHLAVLDGCEVLYLDKIDSPEPVRAYSRVGGRAPAYCVASGKALLAYQTIGGDLDLPDELAAFSPSTHTSVKVVHEDLAAVRRRGYAVNRGEWRAQVGGVAAPVFGAASAPVAAIGISGPLDRVRIDDDRQVQHVRDAARAVSSALGCTSTSYDRRLDTAKG